MPGQWARQGQRAPDGLGRLRVVVDGEAAGELAGSFHGEDAGDEVLFGGAEQRRGALDELAGHADRIGGGGIDDGVSEIDGQ